MKQNSSCHHQSTTSSLTREQRLRKVCLYTVCTIYILIILAMAAATIVEKYEGTQTVMHFWYGSPWFSLLWGILAASAVSWIILQRMRHPITILLHLSMLLILLGALLTHLTAFDGRMRLRLHSETNLYYSQDNKGNITEHHLPFNIYLESFDISHHVGTDATADYTSTLRITDGQETINSQISMNKIFIHRGIRFYQSSYDEDGRGSILSLNSDPWGIPVTYCGYALLFFALIAMLIDPRMGFRRLLRSEALRKSLLVIALIGMATTMQAAQSIPAASAERFGQLYILHNGRICQVQTFAIDLTKKLYGKDHFGDYSAEQVLAGLIFYGEEWCQESLLKIKNGPLKTLHSLPDKASINTFFQPSLGGYILGPYIEEYGQGMQDKLHQQAADIDAKINLFMQTRQGISLKLFPETRDGKTTWYAPTDMLPQQMPAEQQMMISKVFNLLNEQVQQGDYTQFDATIDRIIRYQQIHGAQSLPTQRQVNAERTYNKIPFATILFMLNLTVGFLVMGLVIYLLASRRRGHPQMLHGLFIILFVSFLALTLCLSLRWIISTTIPLGNGYETMLSVAWLVMFIAIIALIVIHRQKKAEQHHLLSLFIYQFSFLSSGLFLLVSHINLMDPAIGRLMPVLNSPLLSIHVSIIMLAYALLSLTFLCGFSAIILRYLPNGKETIETLRTLSMLFLYPALTTLGLGIFIGAIWANVSWGKYWSWDPKETWALITLMIYAIPIHGQSLPVFRRPMVYHLFIVLAFLSLIMTYFGVNYFLGGMHSYA